MSVSAIELNADGELVAKSDMVLMQSTGLTDKNGREIFEGDVLLIPDEWKDVVIPETGEGPMEPFNHLAAVVFQEGAFGVHVTNSGENLKRGFVSFRSLEHELMGEGFVKNECEVIGNIYENPDLLPHD